MSPISARSRRPKMANDEEPQLKIRFKYLRLPQAISSVALGTGRPRESMISKRSSVSHVTPRWREIDSNFWYRGTKAVDFRSIPGICGGIGGALKRYHLMVQPFFFCASNHSIEPGWGT